jgi:iron complex transport system substrate-binding protein
LLSGLARLLLAWLVAAQAHAAVTVTDDAGKRVTLDKPALRVISLSPHATELVFAAGGGRRIVGTVNYSDYPEEAKGIPRVGSNLEIDLERVIALKPDLVVAWMHNHVERQMDMIRQLGVPVFHSDPQTLEGITADILRLGQLMGTEADARKSAGALRHQLAKLRSTYAGHPVVRTFYQVWDKPLYTLNGKHIITDALHACGAENVFGKLATIAPVVTIESVLQADPEAIIGTAEENHGGVGLWRPYGTLTAVRRKNLFTLDGDLLNRPGPRMIAGTAALCEKLELARQRRKK